MSDTFYFTEYFTQQVFTVVGEWKLHSRWGRRGSNNFKMPAGDSWLCPTVVYKTLFLADIQGVCGSNTFQDTAGFLNIIPLKSPRISDRTLGQKLHSQFIALRSQWPHESSNSQGAPLTLDTNPLKHCMCSNQRNPLQHYLVLSLGKKVMSVSVIFLFFFIGTIFQKNTFNSIRDVMFLASVS